MIKLRDKLILISLVSAAFMLPMQANVSVSYSLKLSTGKFPKDVSVENANGVAPDVKAYKQGYTAEGWTVDRLWSLGYVAVSPTYNNEGKESENVLTLPAVTLGEKPMLQWSAQSVYRHFPESYRVEVITKTGGNPEILKEIESEEFTWTSHIADLSAWKGRDVTLRFVCTSSKGYMLALGSVSVLDGESDDSDTSDPDPEPASGFMRNFMIDRATGMWCVNCPAGDIALDELTERFGNRVIAVNTHVRDALANTPYWDEFDWYQVPRMMINRIKASAGDNAKKFEDYYDLPTSFSISLDEIPAPEGRSLNVSARVTVNENIDNSADRYRVGYVVTGDFHNAENPEYVQQNNCTQPYYGAYYFLPSYIQPALMYYDDASITSETAFTGIESSLPAQLTDGESYGVKWQVDVPEVLPDPAKARMVAFVLDTESGEIMNVTALRVGEKPSAGAVIKPADSYAGNCISVVSPGAVSLNLPAGIRYKAEVYTAEGKLRDIKRGIGGNAEIWRPATSAGMNIIVVTTANDITVKKIFF